MAVTQTIEGLCGAIWFHYDVAGDVLYLRQSAHREAEAHGEETNDGLILLRALEDDRVVGMTVVNWWKRFGTGAFPDSLARIVASVEPFARRAASAA